jgi:hypothetical protein
MNHNAKHHHHHHNQEVISGAVAGEASSSSTRFQSQISSLRTYIICHLPLVFISPTSPICHFIRLSFFVRHFSLQICFRVHSCLLVCLHVLDMDPHPLAGLFKRPTYEGPIASELSALDCTYEVLLENFGSEIFATLKYCFENHAPNAYVSEYIKSVFANWKKKMICMNLWIMIALIRLKYPILMNVMLAILLAMMPILMMLMEMNLL